MSIEKSSKRALSRSILSILILGLFLISGKVSAQAVPVNSNNYEILAEKWWQWIAGIPTSMNPIIDESGANAAEDQNGGVWFLAGSFTQTEVNRTITVPKNKMLFFPLINIVADNVGVEPPYTVEELQALTAEIIDLVDSLHATLDGQDISNNLYAFRQGTDGFHAKVPLTDDIYEFLYDTEVGKKVDPIVMDGYWLLLEPLSAGNHTLNFGGGISAFEFAIDVTYNISVTE